MIGDPRLVLHDQDAKVSPGGPADDGMGRVFSDLCHGLHAD